MSEILSSEELNALIGAFRDPSDEEGKLAGQAPVHASDPASEVRLNEAQLAALCLIHGSFAWAAEASLADFLGDSITINLAWQSQMEFQEYLAKCESSLLATVAAPPLKGRLALEVSSAMGQRMLASYFRVAIASVNRTHYNEVEMSVLRDAMDRIVASYAESWRQVARLKPSVKSVEYYPGTNPVALPADPVLVVAIEIKIGTDKELLTLCIPNKVLKPFIAGVATKTGGDRLQPTTLLEMQNTILGEAQVRVAGVREEEVVPGSIIQLGNAGAIEIVGDSGPIGMAELVVVGDTFAIRVQERFSKRRAKQQRTA